MRKKNKIYPFGYFIEAVYILLTLLFQHIPFFGDGVALISHPANFIYDHHFKNFIIPADYDTGHPPLIPAIFALGWQILGRSLITSHLIMLVAIILLFNAYIKFCSRFLQARDLAIPSILFLFYPLIIAQTVTMSADIFLALFFFLAINALLDKKRNRVIIFYSLLLLGSLRGVLCVTALVLTDSILQKDFSPRSMLKAALPACIAALPFIAWNAFHYAQTGWIITHAGSPWIEQRETVNVQGFIWNILIYIFRLCDFGFIAIWIVILTGFFRQQKTETKTLWRIVIILCVTGTVFFIPFKNPILNRYLLIPQMVVLCIASFYIAGYALRKLRIVIVTALCLLFTVSHFIIYPEKMNKAIGYNWDATLAFLPYTNHFREETYRAIQNETSVYMDKTFLVGTGFPVYQSFYDTELTGNMENNIYQQIKIVKLDTTDMEKFDFVIYGNIMNEIPLQVRDSL